jgi:sporulation protein YlmC with PRC-barrel domain
LTLARTTTPEFRSAGTIRSSYTAAGMALGTLLAGTAVAQTPPPPASAPPAISAPAAGQPANPSVPPNLVVASVKQQGGWRASKTIGGDVYNDQNQKIGSIDDLILSPDNKVQFAIISVGGFLGIGSKLVAVPYDQIHFDQDKSARKAVMANGTKEALNAQPSFTYAD